MALSNPELLDIVRKLRMYISSMDNIHFTLNKVKEIDNIPISNSSIELLSIIPTINIRIIQLLVQIEASKAYRDVVKAFNIVENNSQNVSVLQNKEDK